MMWFCDIRMATLTNYLNKYNKNFDSHREMSECTVNSSKRTMDIGAKHSSFSTKINDASQHIEPSFL